MLGKQHNSKPTVCVTYDMKRLRKGAFRFPQNIASFLEAASNKVSEITKNVN
jgi:hypothetical protein